MNKCKKLVLYICGCTKSSYVQYEKRIVHRPARGDIFCRNTKAATLTFQSSSFIAADEKIKMIARKKKGSGTSEDKFDSGVC